MWSGGTFHVLPDWGDGRRTALPEHPATQRPPRAVRRVTDDVVALISSDDEFSPNGPPVGDLVLLHLRAPDEPIVLGPATSWFPSYDGGGVWRVLRAGDAVEHRLDGTAVRSVHLAHDLDAVAATRSGLAAHRPITPRRPYPAHLNVRAHTLIGGRVDDVVAVDVGTGAVTDELVLWGRVVVAGSGGAARVHNSDHNVTVRDPDVLDLDTGRAITDPEPELAWLVGTHPFSRRVGGSVVASYTAPRGLAAVNLVGARHAISDRVRTDPHGRRREVSVWAGDKVLFVEQADDGAVLATWSPSEGRGEPAAARLPHDAIPIACAPS